MESNSLGKSVSGRRAPGRRPRLVPVSVSDGEELDFRKLIEELPLITYVLSAKDNTPLYVSPQDTETFGYNHADYLADPELSFDPLHPDDKERVVAAWDQSRTSGAPFISEHRLYDRRGRLRWFREEASVVCDPDGAPLYLFGVMIDISDRKEAEIERQRSVQRYASLFQHNLDGIYEIDLDGVFKSVNPACELILGYDADELIGRSWKGTVVEEDEARVVDHFLRAADGYPQHFQATLHHKEGHLVDVAITNLPIVVDDRVVGVYGIARDVTEQKRSDAALRASEERFRGVFANAGIGVALVDPLGKMVESNRAFQEMVGYSDEELSRMGFGEITHSQDVPENLRLFNSLMDGELDSYQYEKRYICKDGSTLWGHVTTSLIRDAHGEPLLCVALIENVTERKALEEQLRQSQKMEAVGRLAGGIAHDFNNLLAVIQNCARFLIEDITVDDPRREDADEIVAAGERATTLIRQLLTFSRKEIVNPEVLDLNDVVSEMEKLLRRTIGEDITLGTRLESELRRVKADKGQLEQVLANLAVNARDAMPDGGALTIETLNVQATTELVRSRPGLSPGAYVCLGVSDTGCGMTPEVARRVFDPFFTTKPRGEGTGLGLATVYGIVESAGGRIYVFSEPDAGTSFEIYLPTTEERSGPEEDEKVGVGNVGRGEVVVVAEDDRSVREIVRRILDRKGYRVVAGNALDAVAICANPSAHVDLLVTDVVMPELSGMELAASLRAIRPNCPVVFMSGYTGEILPRHELRAEDVFIGKPFTEEEIAGAVRVALDAGRP